MARTREDFDFKKRGAPAKYPWDQWLDGRIWELTQGEGKDFESSLGSMDDLIRTRGKERGLRVRIFHDPEGGKLILQALPDPKAGPKEPEEKPKTEEKPKAEEKPAKRKRKPKR